MPDLLPGPDLDRQTALAAGLHLRHVRYPSGELVESWDLGQDVEPIPVQCFRPSLDWNDAVLLATMCGIDGVHIRLAEGPEQICRGILNTARMVREGEPFAMCVENVQIEMEITR